MTSLAEARLDDKYTVTQGRVFLTGVQALVRLPMLQRLRDEAAGLNTAGFVSGYRGSPLGALDLNLWKARDHLARHHVVFQPGINEDLAATACWGTQQLDLRPADNRYDGVFGLWYGKGPGVDRSGDVFRHANAAGSSRFGGVLAVAGDDHAAKSSTLPHQTEHLFKAMMIPVLAPSGVQEYIDLGLHGWAMSRYSGCWVAFKALADTVEAAATVDVDPLRLPIILPEDFVLPEGGLNIRWPDPPRVQEARLLEYKLYAALAYCRANRLNRVVIDSPTPRLGIICSGKSYLDVRQAFDDLGIDDTLAAEIGIRLYKVGMVWPLESQGVRKFAEGLEEILVVEEKRQLLEYQLKEELYNWREDVRPRVIGKFDEKGEWALPHGEWLLPAASELSPSQIARVIASRIGRFFTSTTIRERLALIEAKQRVLEHPVTPAQRTPFFCSGCPHNTSTQLPDGSRAVAGIGCHYMVTWMGRNTATFTHMGGEGVPWIGQAPFTKEKHIFANLGDGTYFHSGLLAIRAAVAAKVPITYKLLYNDAVAMTGGQPVDGSLSVPQIARQLDAEGVHEIVVVTDEPEKYLGVTLPHGVPVRPRNELDVIQRQLREYPGVSVLIYDQTCAAEKRRRRKRKAFPDPTRRVFINEAVCEGCGDCSRTSNCLSIVPVETEYGRKRAIDQSSCNKDYSCLEGFCPAMVTIEGGRPRRGKAMATDENSLPVHLHDLPPPTLPDTRSPYGILVTGVGGTGVVTIGALIGMAAHLDGLGVTTLDMTGLAQKGGSVWSHIRIANSPDDLHATRIAVGEANAIIGGDLIVTAGSEALARMLAGQTRAVVNCSETPTAEFTQNPDWQFPLDAMRDAISQACGENAVLFMDAHGLSERLMGDALFSNLFLLGCAWQNGLVPVSLQALTRAIELNDVAVKQNVEAFHWGRRAAIDLPTIESLTQPGEQVARAHRPSQSLDERIARRVRALASYQDAAYANRYKKQLAALRSNPLLGDAHPLIETVADLYFRLLAYKDEYEVARLYTEPAFLDAVNEAFEGDYQVRFHLAPPQLTRPDPVTGQLRKRRYGPWMLTAFRWLARGKRLRGGFWDFFGRHPERREERALVADYEQDLDHLVRHLTADNLAEGLAFVAWPAGIRGFGPIKMATIKSARSLRHAHRLAFDRAAPPE